MLLTLPFASLQKKKIQNLLSTYLRLTFHKKFQNYCMISSCKPSKSEKRKFRKNTLVVQDSPVSRENSRDNCLGGSRSTQNLYVSFRICLKLESKLDCWFKLKQNHIFTPLCIKLDSKGFSHSSLWTFRFTIAGSWRFSRILSCC